jgi:hypothetical protein
MCRAFADASSFNQPDWQLERVEREEHGMFAGILI